MPSARDEQLVVEELTEETLVYDLERHRAHCLNKTSALVWRMCDGRTTVAAVARALENDLGLPDDEEIVWLALDRLRRAKLLDGAADIPKDAVSHSRRDLVRKLAVVGGISVLLPVVTSITSPLAAQAGSSTTARDCFTNCQGVGLPCSDWAGRVCSEFRWGRRTFCFCR